MPPINPEREAYAFAARTLYWQLWENKLRRQYKHLSAEQQEELVNKYRNIIADLDAHIVEINRQEAEARKANASA